VIASKPVLVLGWGMLLTSYVIMMMTFLIAALNPAGVLIRVNDYGEGLWESVVLVTSVPCVLYVFIRFLKEQSGTT